MEENTPNNNINTHPESTIHQSETPNYKPQSQRKLILIIIGISLLIALFSSIFYYLGSNNKSDSVATKDEIISTNNASPTPQNTTNTDSNLSASAPDVVSYAIQGNDLVMRYRGKVYSYDKTNEWMNEPKSISESGYSSLNWIPLIQAPQSATDATSKNGLSLDRVFDFVKLSNGDILFVMQWDRIIDNKGTTDTDMPVYYFNATNQTVTKLLDETWSGDDNGYHVPSVNSVSPDNKLIALDMHGCSNCGGHYPEIKLLNINTKATKNLGRIIEFKWTGNNTYSYKEYKEVECSEPQPGVCLEDSKNLPLKSGNF